MRIAVWDAVSLFKRTTTVFCWISIGISSALQAPFAMSHSLSSVGVGPANFSVDVVIPVLNEAHVLRKSLETLLNFLQANLDYRWQVVIVDNGSTDGTRRTRTDSCPFASPIHLPSAARTWPGAPACVAAE
jgi:hypothetical protein